MDTLSTWVNISGILLQGLATFQMVGKFKVINSTPKFKVPPRMGRTTSLLETGDQVMDLRKYVEDLASDLNSVNREYSKAYKASVYWLGLLLFGMGLQLIAFLL